ncbi:protein proton gradient regulation 5, chloroplastic [Galdieria sulphuraria]|nr:protein proton gradient regulation 5, chloroplastic [Galdieria sulphuraria]
MSYCNFISTFAVKDSIRSIFLLSSQFSSSCCPHTLRVNKGILVGRRRIKQSAIEVYMGKVSNFGPFTPVVYVTRWVLGKDRFNKIRGRAIALHSQVITEFCKRMVASLVFYLKIKEDL